MQRQHNSELGKQSYVGFTSSLPGDDEGQGQNQA